LPFYGAITKSILNVFMGLNPIGLNLPEKPVNQAKLGLLHPLQAAKEGTLSTQVPPGEIRGWCLQGYRAQTGVLNWVRTGGFSAPLGQGGSRKPGFEGDS
jgi:hypothetical protein